MNRQQAIDIMRDVYMTRQQREAYECLIALPDDTAEPVACIDPTSGEIEFFVPIKGFKKIPLYTHPPKDTAERDAVNISPEYVEETAKRKDERAALVLEIDKQISIPICQLAEEPMGINQLLTKIRAYLTRDHIRDVTKKVGG